MKHVRHLVRREGYWSIQCYLWPKESVCFLSVLRALGKHEVIKLNSAKGPSIPCSWRFEIGKVV